MFEQIIGFFMIILGALCAAWPQLLRGWLVGRASWMIFWAVGFFLYPFLSPFTRTWHMGEWVACFVTVILLGGMLRKVLSQAAEKVPALYYRIGGSLMLLSGLYVIFVKPL